MKYHFGDYRFQSARDLADMLSRLGEPQDVWIAAGPFSTKLSCERLHELGMSPRGVECWMRVELETGLLQISYAPLDEFYEDMPEYYRIAFITRRLTLRRMTDFFTRYLGLSLHTARRLARRLLGTIWSQMSIHAYRELTKLVSCSPDLELMLTNAFCEPTIAEQIVDLLRGEDRTTDLELRRDRLVYYG